MTGLVITWLVAPFLAAFLAALKPPLARPLLLLSSAATAAMAAAAQQGWLAGPLQLLGPLGVALRLDDLAAPFLLLNGLVVAAAVLQGWRRPGSEPALLLLLVLQGSLNTAVVAVDLISIYVALEAVGIAVLLLLAQGRGEGAIWLALRYGLVSNTVMLLYLIGAALIYQERHSFAMAGVAEVGGLAVALMAVGLLTKAELFVGGLWLPRTNAEVPPELSAVLSGAVTGAGIVPLLRLVEVAPPLATVLQVVGLGGAVLASLYALAEADARRLLAWSTLAQMGLVLVAPATAGLYALAHGLAKAGLFLALENLQRLRLPLLVAALSIAGVPPLLGFFAKELQEQGLAGVLGVLVTLLGVATVAVYARLWNGAATNPAVAGVGADQTAVVDPAAAGAAAGSPGPVGAVLLCLALVLLNLSPWAQAGWADLASSGLGWPLLKTALTLAAGIGLQRWLEPWWSRWRLPLLERLDDLLAAVVLTGAGLVLALGR